jgi:hypothetical protein
MPDNEMIAGIFPGEAIIVEPGKVYCRAANPKKGKARLTLPGRLLKVKGLTLLKLHLSRQAQEAKGENEAGRGIKGKSFKKEKINGCDIRM